jgi:hypothetical protein
MISETDIEDWDNDTYLKVVEDIPEEDRKVSFKEVGEDLVLDLELFMVSYGKALHTVFKKHYNL